MRPCARSHCVCYCQYLVAKVAGSRAIERAAARQRACKVLSPWATDELYEPQRSLNGAAADAMRSQHALSRDMSERKRS